MDGVMQAPGGPEEDTSGGFTFGGWSAPYWDDTLGQVMAEQMTPPFDLLLGRKTYDIFAGYWPQHNEEGAPLNTATKYVVSHQTRDLSWKPSQLITGDVNTELRKLKNQDGPMLQVHGSGNLIQTLLTANVIDTMIIWIFPVTVGKGKRLFAEGSHPAAWKLTDSKTAETGVVIATYEPAGALKTGTIGE